jgi:1-acyl-sn-glycerol-3-phosphate acyltransferase
MAGKPLTRWLCRLLAFTAQRKLVSIGGLEHIAPERDPFILALNHSQRLEALLVPPLLIWHRDGKLIRFVADWNFQLVPGIGLLFRKGGVVTVRTKPARPRVLDRFRPRGDGGPFAEARGLLERGESLGIFPEGTVQRDPRHLLPGRPGAARLSLECGVPVVPCGVRYPNHPPGRPAGELARMSLAIGAPRHPPPVSARRAPAHDVADWHARIMQDIADLSGKSVAPATSRRPAPKPGASTT